MLWAVSGENHPSFRRRDAAIKIREINTILTLIITGGTDHQHRPGSSRIKIRRRCEHMKGRCCQFAQPAISPAHLKRQVFTIAPPAKRKFRRTSEEQRSLLRERIERQLNLVFLATKCSRKAELSIHHSKTEIFFAGTLPLRFRR
jgi:hypothetical protein